MQPVRQAKYVMMIPRRDNLGNNLGDLATAAHMHLFKTTGNEGSYIEGPKRGNWRDSPQEEFDHLVTYAPDTPEMDGHFKQLAKHIAEAANQWGIFWAKEGGKSGVQSGIVNNPNYVEGQPAPAAQYAPPVPEPVNQVAL